MKKALIIIGVVVLILGIGAGIVMIKLIQAGDETSEIFAALEIDDIDLTKISDGEYAGMFETPLISAHVTVTVSNQKITQIEIVRHENWRGQPGEEVAERVVAAQSLDVEVISGATFSSKAILAAIADALNN